jgi:hypothetical protein
LNRKTFITLIIIILIIIIAGASLAFYKRPSRTSQQNMSTISGTVPSTSITTTSSLSVTSETLARTPILKEMLFLINVTCNGWRVKEILTYSPPSGIPVNVLVLQAKDIIKNLNETVKSYGGSLIACNYSVETNEVIVNCIIKGFVWKSGKECYADTSWIIGPLGLDLIDNHFNETNYSLSWSGYVKGVRLSITFYLPPQEVPYKAWQDKVGHCHAHIWWPVSTSS